MKKLLALVLVLGMASISSAGLFDITVGPNHDQLVEEIFDVHVSDYIELGIYRTPPTSYLTGVYYVLVCDQAVGTIDGGVGVVYPSSNSDGIIQVSAEVYKPARDYYPGLPEGVDAYFNFDEYDEEMFEAPDTVPAGMQYVDIAFHCEGEGDAIVELYTASEVGTAGIWTLRDTLIIHQIPEPVTMALLGLGGLALLRRRRA